MSYRSEHFSIIRLDDLGAFFLHRVTKHVVGCQKEPCVRAALNYSTSSAGRKCRRIIGSLNAVGRAGLT